MLAPWRAMAVALLIRCRSLALLLTIALAIGPAGSVGAAPDASAGRDGGGPAVLFCSPTGLKGWGGVDLAFLEELHADGFDPDYLEHHRNFTWDRVKRYDVLVLYGTPGGPGEKSQFRGEPGREAYIEIVNRFIKAGGGVFTSVMVRNADHHCRPMIEPWGARIALEHYKEDDPSRIREMPRMRGRPMERLFLTSNINDSPISEDVDHLWLPYGPHYSTTWVSPLKLSDKWRVVVRGSPTSYSEPADLDELLIPPQDDPVRREGGVEEPIILGIREYTQGRVALTAQHPVWSFGQGTKWLFNRRVLSEGFGGRASDYGQLLRNACRWLAQPAMANDQLGGYEADPERFQPPNAKQGAREQFRERYWSEQAVQRHQPAEGDFYRGVIGPRTVYSGGTGSVGDYAEAAKQAGLDYVVFLEHFSELTPGELDELTAACKRHSDDELRLIPGYRMRVNTNNRMFFYAQDPVWPSDRVLTGENNDVLNLQWQNEKGEYTKKPIALRWLLDNWHHQGRANCGYFDFSHPRGQKMSDARLYAAAGVLFYRDNELVADDTEDYLATAAGTLPPTPVSINLISSPGALREAPDTGAALTYVKAGSLDRIIDDGLRWSHQFDGLGVFPSSGPKIQRWPACERMHTYGGARFVVGRELMIAPLTVTSDVGLEQVRIYNGRRLIRRFRPDGANELDKTLHLSSAIQQNLVVVAEDIEGGKAVSYARRSLHQGNGHGILFCGDHVNDCPHKMLARGPGLFHTARAPRMFVGWTWDGGPEGRRPLVDPAFNYVHLVSDEGTESGDPASPRSLNNTPILEFTDDQAAVVRSTLERKYPEGVPASNPWRTYGPLVPTELFTATRRYIEYTRPVRRVVPYGWPGRADRGGAMVGSYVNTVRFKRDQTLKRLTLLLSKWIDAKPLMLVVGDGPDAELINLHDGSGRVDRRIERGQWFGLYHPGTTNPLLMLNRGAPIRVRFGRGDDRKQLRILGDVNGRRVEQGESIRYELFSVVDSLRMEQRGPSRFLRLLSYLREPEGVRVHRGGRVESIGFLELEAADHAVELSVEKPDRPLRATLPVRVRGLNPNWSAGFYQREGYTPGYYTDGEKVYTSLGFDFDGRVYGALFPDKAEQTRAVIGHPVVCDNTELVIQTMPRTTKDGGYAWHVAVNNPTDEPITATFEQAMDVRGLDFETQKHTIEPGGYRVLMR